MAINGINSMREVENKGRPGLSDDKIVQLLLYKFRNQTNYKISKLLKIAPSTVNKYWSMYEKDEIDPKLVEAAQKSYEMVASVGNIAENVGVKEDLTPLCDAEEQSLVKVDEILNMAAVSKIFQAAMKEASGEFIEEKITGSGIKHSNNPNGIVSKFGFTIDEEARVVVDLQRSRPNIKNLMSLVEFFKNHGIDCFKALKEELGISGDSEGIDISDLSPEEAGSAYQQLMNGETDD